MAIILLTLKEAAEQYSLALEQLRDLARSGKMNIVTMDGQEMVSDDEVRKVAGNNGNHVHWISLRDASARHALSEALLERLAKDGVVRSGILEDELHLAVEDIEPIALRLSRDNFRRLEGTPIELARAVEQYGFPFRSLFWTFHFRSSSRPLRPENTARPAELGYSRLPGRMRCNWYRATSHCAPPPEHH